MKTIFIVEDDAAIRQLLRVFFDKNHEVEAIISSEPALCPLYTKEACVCPMERPCGDLMLVDNLLPEMTGLELIEAQMRKGCKGSVRNKAVMSASFTEEQLSTARRLGCRVFKKPFALREIAAWVEGA